MQLEGKEQNQSEECRCRWARRSGWFRRYQCHVQMRYCSSTFHISVLPGKTQMGSMETLFWQCLDEDADKFPNAYIIQYCLKTLP